MSNLPQETRDQLEEEQRLGNRAQKAYVDFIEPFIAGKRIALCQNFFDAKIDQLEEMLEAKRLNMILDSMENEVLSVINTGKMASQQLNPTSE